MMESEAEALRRLSQSRSMHVKEKGLGLLRGEGMDPKFDFSGVEVGNRDLNGPSGKKEKGRGGKTVEFDSLEELSKGDTPQMERNKLMRAGHSLPSRSNSHSTSGGEGINPNEDRLGSKKEKGKGGKGHSRRRSSSNRGKRISSLFEGGVICEFSLFLFPFIVFFFPRASSSIHFFYTSVFVLLVVY